MTPQPVTVSPKDPLTQVLYLLNRFKLSRLPVTEGTKLVGIITRADIIQAESDRISGEQSFGPQSEPSYVVYQTRSPAVGKGRLLVPLSNPQTAPLLLKMAVAIAQARHYELECLQVIRVPRSQSPAETDVRTTASRRLLRQAEHWVQNLSSGDWHIPVHTQVCLAHDAAQAMLETIQERHIDLILMGWKGSTSTPGRVFGSVVDTVIRQASCEVIVVKLSETERFDRWLVPLAGGPNSQQALKLLPALSTLSLTPDIRLCQVFEPGAAALNVDLLQHSVDQLSHQLACPILAHPIWGKSVSEAVVKLAWKEHCDVIVVGASREGLLQQAIKSNIPEAIARNSNQTVILVRGVISIEG